MTSRRLLYLSIAALLAIGVGVWLATRQTSSNGGETALLYPELKQQLDAVQAVRIFKAGDARAVEIARKDGGWGVSERSGYAVDESKLRTFLRGLADAKVLEEKTSNPENYGSLSVGDVSKADASGVRVEVVGTAIPVNLIVGKAGPGGRSHYVRRAGEAQSWLVDADLDASSTPDAWLARNILDVSADRIQSATVTTGKDKPYTAAKASRADANFSVGDLPRGKKLNSPSAANGFATALSSLTLNDVQPESAFESADPDAQATFKSFDGLVVELQGWEREDKRFIAVKSSHDRELAERFKVATAAAADEKAKEGEGGATEEAAAAKKAETAAAEAKKPNVEEDVQKANARTAGWVYEIPTYKYEQIFKPVGDLTS